MVSHGQGGYDEEDQDDIIRIDSPELQPSDSERREAVHVAGSLSDRAVMARRYVGERVVICLDGSHLFYSATRLGIEIDYCKLQKIVTAGRSLLRAYFYTGVDPTSKKQKDFLLFMQRNGYRLVARELESSADGSNKANLDVELAVDLVQLAEHCDTIVLLSGHGNLAYAVEQASQKGARFELVSLRSMTNEALLNVVDQYVDLEEIAPMIRKTPKPRPTKIADLDDETTLNDAPE